MSGDIERLLDRDERIVWSGQPKQGLMLRAEDVFLIPFSLAWFGFALFWEATVLWYGATKMDGPPVMFPLVGLVFVCVGAYLAIGRFFFDAWKRKNTRYAITNKRAIISRSGFRNAFRSYDLAKNAELELKERRDGSGSIVFGGTEKTSFFTPRMRGWPGMEPQIFEFERIPEVTRVYGLIRQASGH